MQSELIHEYDGQKTFALIFETGDEVAAGLAKFARDQKLAAAHFTSIGTGWQAKGLFQGGSISVFGYGSEEAAVEGWKRAAESVAAARARTIVG
jgi:hypothetical protein